MKIRRVLLTLIGTTSLALSSCTSDTNDETAATITSTTETTSSSTPPTSSTEETISSETSTEIPATTFTPTVENPKPEVPSVIHTPTQQVTAPTFVECIHGGGSWTSNALMSDGSYQWAAECQQKLDEQRAIAPYQCPQTDYFVPDPWYCENQSVPWSVPPPSEAATPAYLLPDSPEEIASRQWWSDCMAQNNAEYCRSADPYVNG